MLTKEQVIEAVKNGRESECLDGRDYSSLVNYFPVDQWHLFGIQLKEGAEAPPIKEWTCKAIISELKEDNDFGFEKALNKRGISSSLQYSSVKLWLWVLEDELQHMKEYAQYGLPLFKAVALKYGFENPIGEDSGDESEYSTYG